MNQDVKGIATFTNGELHGGPCSIQVKSHGERAIFESMVHGKPAGIERQYCGDKH